MFSKEFMTYLLNIDSENAPKTEKETKKEVSFTAVKSMQPVLIEIRTK